MKTPGKICILFYDFHKLLAGERTKALNTSGRLQMQKLLGEGGRRRRGWRKKWVSLGGGDGIPYPFYPPYPPLSILADLSL